MAEQNKYRLDRKQFDDWREWGPRDRFISLIRAAGGAYAEDFIEGMTGEQMDSFIRRGDWPQVYSWVKFWDGTLSDYCLNIVPGNAKPWDESDPELRGLWETEARWEAEMTLCKHCMLYLLDNPGAVEDKLYEWLETANWATSLEYLRQDLGLTAGEIDLLKHSKRWRAYWSEKIGGALGCAL